MYGLRFKVWGLLFVVFGAWGFRVSGLQIVNSAFVFETRTTSPRHRQSNFGPTYHPGLDEKCQRFALNSEF